MGGMVGGRRRFAGGHGGVIVRDGDEAGRADGADASGVGAGA